VGYKITGPNISVLFIPDIDKWTSWETDIVAAIYEVEYAFLDATFYDGEEIDNRDISEIPHPFVIESLALFRDLPDEERSKINFIHFNHTNPLLNIESAASRQLLDKGYHIARLRQTLKL
jgi:pyrroloquinoline quinone biosynthesis protein B